MALAPLMRPHVGKPRGTAFFSKARLRSRSSGEKSQNPCREKEKKQPLLRPVGSGRQTHRPTGAQFSFHADICYKTNFEFAPIQLLVAQIKNEFAKNLKSETAGAQSLLYGVAQKLIRATTLNALFEGQHPKFRPRLTAKKLRVREQVLGRQAKDRAWLGLQRRREAPSWRRVEC